MKISSIDITNFKGIDNMSIQPEHLNIYLGKNGTGKTAVLSAISFALTGDMDKLWIKSKEKFASVKIVFEDNSSIERKRSTDGITTVKVNGKRSSQKALSVFLKDKLGTNEDTMRALCGVNYLETLSSQELTKTILSILPLKANREKILEFAQKIQKNELKRNLSKEEEDYLLSLLSDFPDVLTLEHLKEAHAVEMEKRKELRAQEKVLSAKINIDSSVLPKESKEELQNKLEDLMKKELKMADYKKQLSDYQMALNAITTAKEKEKTLKEQIQAMKDIIAPDPEQLEIFEDEKKKFETSIKQVSEIMATNQANKQFLERTLESLNKPVCPLSDRLICKTDKSKLRKEIEELIQKNSETIQRQTEHIKRCEEQIAKREHFIKKYNENQLQYVKKESYLKQLQELVIPKAPEKPVAVKIEDLCKEKEEINKKLSVIAENDVTKKYQTQYQDIKTKLKNSEFGVAMLESKHGIPSLILKMCLSNLETLCNSRAKELNPLLKVKIIYEGSIKLLADFKGNDIYLPAEVLSTAECLILIFLIMCIFNQLTGAKYMIIDNLDKLDAYNTKQFIQLLKKDSSYDHIFLAGVNHLDTVELLQKQNVIIL